MLAMHMYRNGYEAGSRLAQGMLPQPLFSTTFLVNQIVKVTNSSRDGPLNHVEQYLSERGQLEEDHWGEEVKKQQVTLEVSLRRFRRVSGARKAGVPFIGPSYVSSDSR